MHCMLVIGIAVSQPAGAADLYQPRFQSSLISDRRAVHVGDIVTVLVFENSTASNTADTSTKTSAEVHGDVSSAGNSRHAGSVGLGDNYGGRGQIQRSGRLLAQISTTITKVADNGDLYVRGQQVINVNGELTKIRLSGRVRSIDIDSNNTVQSNRLAEASIDYVGDGFLTDRTRPGLIPRVFAWLGLW